MMATTTINNQGPVLLIHPPAAKPSEPPVGLACIAGALEAHAAPHLVIDANLEELLWLLPRQELRDLFDLSR